MRRVEQLWSVALGMCVLAAGASCGQTEAEPTSKETKQTTSKQSSPGADVQPNPKELVRQMADYLCGLPAFSCRVEILIKIEAQGQMRESATELVARLQRPNKLSVVVEAGPSGMTLISDGKELVQYIPSMSRYTVSEAPADIATLVGSDSFALGGAGQLLPTEAEQFYEKLMAGVTGSEYLGIETVGDIDCHHCKFLQESFDWELWIDTGERRLPRKFVPDYSQRLDAAEGATVDYVVTFDAWDVAPKFTEADFQFEPPAGVEQVDSLFEGLDSDGGGPHPLLGEVAPTFETTDLAGQPVDLKSYLGKNVIMLDFWATWCGPCVMAMPQIDAVADKFADRGLVFFAVNVGEDADTIKTFLKSKKVELPVAMDQEHKIAGLYQAHGIPQTVLIGKDGKVQVVHVGFTDSLEDELTKEVEDLLAGKDLATEVLAKAAEAKKKRATAKKQAQTVGVTPAWSLPGRWTGVAAPTANDKIYAITDDKIVAVNSSGEVQQEIPTGSVGTLRLASLSGDGAPEFIVFEPWRSGVNALSGSGEALWQYPAGDGVDDVWAADVNGDGIDEVIIGFNGGTGLHVLDHRGTLLWKFTDIGNVWHVTAGDLNGDGRNEVVSTSAAGDLHVFDAAGRKLKDIDLSVYGNMVRMATLGDGSVLAIVTGTGDEGESLVGVTFDGNEKLAVDLSTAGVGHVDDLAIAPTISWTAVAMRGGLVNVVDLESGQTVAQVADQQMAPHVAWMLRKDQPPLLVVATGGELNAFEVTPEAAEEVTVVEEPDDSKVATAPAEVIEAAAPPKR